MMENRKQKEKTDQKQALPLKEKIKLQADRKKHDRQILARIGHILNLIIPISIPMVAILLINDFLRHSAVNVYIDTASMLFLILLTIFRNKISNRLKIFFMALLTYTVGFAALIVSGYAGTGIIVLLIGSIFITGFLSKRTSIIYALILAVSMTVFIVLVQLGIVVFDISDDRYNPNLFPGWVNDFVIFILCLLVIFIVINVIKKFFGMSLDKTEEQLEVIHHLAYYDSLTGLPNKNKLLSEIDKKYGNAGLLVLFSVDGYKLIDSIYGEEVTNEIILAISGLLVARKEYFLEYAKTDVNEFAFVWKKDCMGEFLPFVKQCADEVQTLQAITKWKRGIHFHLGYFEFESLSVGILEAYQKAKIALQEATTNHARLPVKYDAEIEDRIKAEYNFKHLVDSAISNHEFTVIYQEKVDNGNQKIIGVEALARWESKEMGLVSPGVFIPVVEKSTLFSEFGNQIIRLVLSDYDKLCKKYSPDIKVSINVSPQHLLSQEFLNYIANEMDMDKIKPENIIFEITEEMLLDNIDNALGVIKELKRYGFKISLDDFGSGYSSLSYLSRLIFDEVKIDKTFTDQIAVDSKIVKIIEVISTLRDIYGFDIVVEGVETEEQYNILKKIGHFIIQGYYFSKPQRIE